MPVLTESYLDRLEKLLDLTDFSSSEIVSFMKACLFCSFKVYQVNSVGI